MRTAVPTPVAAAVALALLASHASTGCNSAPPPATASAPGPASAAASEPAPAIAPAIASAPASPSSPASAGSAPAPTAAASPGDDPLVGQPAPDFTATAQDGSSVHLAALRGKPVVLYFYPKDETPGCTKEACSFRDAWAPLAKTGAVLVGVSADAAASHKAFIAHWKLPFLLTTDADGSLGKRFGVPFTSYHARQTFVIGADGTVRKVYRKVDVSTHAQQILEDLARL
jgi:peroxiredoxin Q/BCP